METIIYVVTRGKYSDYRICNLFSTKELAQLFIDSFTNEDCSAFRIHSYKLDNLAHELQQGYRPFSLKMTKEGEVYDIEDEYDVSDCDFINDKQNIEFINDELWMSVYAKDIEHAIKIVNEKRLELIGLNYWKNDMTN
jgi:hypothetical protein